MTLGLWLIEDSIYNVFGMIMKRKTKKINLLYLFLALLIFLLSLKLRSLQWFILSLFFLILALYFEDEI